MFLIITGYIPLSTCALQPYICAAGGGLPTVLQWVKLPIPSNKDCQKTFDDQLGKDIAIIDETKVCAGNLPEHKYDSCQVSRTTVCTSCHV